jgi:hypothetical protein
MNNKRKISALGVILLGVMTISIQLSAQDPEREHHRAKHHTYKLIDSGTFGGPNGLVNGPGIPILSDRGTYAGEAETSIPDPYAPNCRDRDCLVEHAQRWRHGIVADLGTLPGTNLSSEATWVSPRGRIVGFSQNGLIDPLLGIPEIRAVRWTRNGRIIDLGTLEGGHESFATIVNDGGLVGGFSTNTIADPFSMAGLGYQTRGFLLEDGVLQDIGTLGGPDTLPLSINKRGQ